MQNLRKQRSTTAATTLKLTAQLKRIGGKLEGTSNLEWNDGYCRMGLH